MSPAPRHRRLILPLAAASALAALAATVVEDPPGAARSDAGRMHPSSSPLMLVATDGEPAPDDTAAASGSPPEMTGVAAPATHNAQPSSPANPTSRSEYIRSLLYSSDWLAYRIGLAEILATHDDPQVRDASTALVLAWQAARQGQDSLDALDALAAAFAASGRFDEAVQTARRAVDKSQGSTSRAARERRRERLSTYQRQSALWLPGEIPFDPAIHLDTTRRAAAFAHAHWALGRRLYADSRPLSALKAFRTALAFSPHFRHAHIEHTKQLIELRRFHEAEENLAPVVERLPHDAELAGYLGMVKLRREQLPEAHRLLRTAVAARPDWHEAANNLAWIYAVSPHPQFRQPRAALELAERICAADAANPSYLDTLAAAFASVGRFDEAMATVRRAIALDESSADVPAMKMRLRLYKEGEPFRVQPRTAAATGKLLDQRRGAEAEDAIGARLAAGRRDADDLANLGLIRLTQKRIEEAVKLWDEAIAKGGIAPATARRLAHVTTMHPDPRIRNPSRAVELARRACAGTAYRHLGSLDTLAAAYAAAEQFDKAVRTQQRAIDAARSRGSLQRLAVRQTRLELFKRRRPLTSDYVYGGEEFITDVLIRLEQNPADVDSMIELHRRRLDLRRDWAEVVDRLAWILATHDDARFRDPRLAEDFAAETCARTAYEEPRFLDTLAAAKAQRGEFRRAAELVKQALRQVTIEASGYRQALEQRLLQYEARRPFWEPQLPVAEDLPRQLTSRKRLAYVHQMAADRLFAEDSPSLAAELYDLTLRLDPRNRHAHLARGKLARQQGDHELAQNHLSIALWLESYDPEALVELALARFDLGMPAQTVRLFAAALDLRPEWPQARNNLAWLLATHDQVRDGPRAVQLIEPLCRGETNPQFLDTLAAAYAAAGRFEDARRTARRSVELAEAHGRAEKAAQIRARLALYAAGRDYRFPSRAPLANDASGFKLSLPDAIQTAPSREDAAQSIPLDDLAALAVHRGDFAQAQALLRRAIDQQPDERRLVFRLAWLLATHPESQHGDRLRALELLNWRANRDRNPSLRQLEILAAAQAAGGRFEAAIATCRKAISAARSVGLDTAAGRLVQQLKNYRCGQLPLPTQSHNGALGSSRSSAPDA